MSSVTENYPDEIVQLMGEVKNKLHRWRLCSKGSHYKGGTTQVVKTKIKDFPVFKLPPSIWKCVLSASKKDLLHAEEIGVIASIFFPHLSGSPKADNLGFKNGNDFDSFIRGWTRYWNDILEPDVELDCNLVKALIASESSFNINPPPQSVLGLMQLTLESRLSLGKLKGEIKDHYVVANIEQIIEPSVNICAGIRWLFHKRYLLKVKIKRNPTWEETVAAYKNYYQAYQKNLDYRGMGVFNGFYKRLTK